MDVFRSRPSKKVSSFIESGFKNTIYLDGLIGYWDANNLISAPTGNNGTTWKNLSTFPQNMGDINIQGAVTDWTYGSSSNIGYVQNSTSRDGGGMPVNLVNWNKSKGTMEFWLMHTSYSLSNGYFVNRSDSTANDDRWFWLGSWDSGSILYFRKGIPGACCNFDLTVSSYSSSVPINVWKHVVFTWNFYSQSNSSSFIYINGSQSATRIDGTNHSASNVSDTGRFGIGHSNTNSQMLGRFSKIRCYNIPLTSTQVLQNFNSERAIFGV